MTEVQQLLQAVGLGLVTLLPLTNPLTTVALLLGFAGTMSREEIKRQSDRASLYVFIIMVVAFYGGQAVMNTFGISLPGLRIGGGLIVSFIGFRMLFPQPTPATALEIDQKRTDLKIQRSHDIAFVPLAMPSTAGPGTIAMLISLASSVRQSHFPQWVIATAPILIFVLISVILWLCLRSSERIMQFLGRSGIEAIARLMGFLLVCMGVQFIINGILEIVHELMAAS